MFQIVQNLIQILYKKYSKKKYYKYYIANNYQFLAKLQPMGNNCVCEGQQYETAPQFKEGYYKQNVKTKQIRRLASTQTQKQIQLQNTKQSKLHLDKKDSIKQQENMSQVLSNYQSSVKGYPYNIDHRHKVSIIAPSQDRMTVMMKLQQTSQVPSQIFVNHNMSDYFKTIKSVKSSSKKYSFLKQSQKRQSSKGNNFINVNESGQSNITFGNIVKIDRNNTIDIDGRQTATNFEEKDHNGQSPRITRSELKGRQIAQTTPSIPHPALSELKMTKSIKPPNQKFVSMTQLKNNNS